jgi:glutamate-5-semialdehyde dehydrogenase
MSDHVALLAEQCRSARTATRTLARTTRDQRDGALRGIAAELRARTGAILEANAADVAAFEGSDAMRDRLTLTSDRVAQMAAGVETVAHLPDPLGRTLARFEPPSGLDIRRVSVPIGVVGMIYESRPNVGADAAALTIKSGNAVILRGGSESFHSAGAIGAAITAGLHAAGLPQSAVQFAPGTDRAYVAAMLAATGQIDVIIPRGGRGLVERVQNEARVPVLSHAEGLCHTYLDAAADRDMAVRLVVNAKLRRTGICGATETLLVDEAVAETLLPPVLAALRERGCEIRADDRARALVAGLAPAGPDDFDTEWLAPILSVAIVDGVEGAVAHILRHGSLHTEAIVTENPDAARRFIDGVDSAVVMWNASTQFCDGFEFGFGAEIGISTGRLHARGPVGLEQLTTFRYEVIGKGQERP